MWRNKNRRTRAALMRMHEPTAATAAIPVIPAVPECAEKARRLAARWGFTPKAELPDAGFALLCTLERLELRQVGPRPAVGPVAVDFAGGPLEHRRRFGGGRGQPLAKAVGLKRGRNPTVLDATAGWGRDAYVLASLGCRVTMVERSVLLSALVEDALYRAGRVEGIEEIAARLELIHGDALEVLPGFRPPPEVVYLDPMYPPPPGKKSAQVKKEMRLLRSLLGPQDDAGELLACALRVATERVVVKRPDFAEPLGGRAPTLHFATRKHRFDVYVQRAMGGARIENPTPRRNDAKAAKNRTGMPGAGKRRE